MAHGVTLQTAVTLALSKFCLDQHPTAEQMDGAKRFIDILLNLGERQEEREQIMYKSITTMIPPNPNQPPTKK